MVLSTSCMKKPVTLAVVAIAISIMACGEAPDDEDDDALQEPEAATESPLTQSCSEWVMTAGAVGALTVTLAAATATCAGALLVTGPGEVVCALPAGATAAVAIANVIAGAGVILACTDTGRRLNARVQAPPRTSSTRCNPDELRAGCNCAELARRKAIQDARCKGDNGTCNRTTSCGETDRVMRVTRNCINARREVMQCFQRPDYGGHQQAIREQCARFRRCIDRANTCGIDASVLPVPCR